MRSGWLAAGSLLWKFPNIQSFRSELGTCGYLNGFLYKKCFFALLIRWLDTGYINRPCLERCHFYSEIGLEVNFSTTLQNRKLQMPSSWYNQRPVFPLTSYSIYVVFIFTGKHPPSSEQTRKKNIIWLSADIIIGSALKTERCKNKRGKLES